jgi:hypothetical protein
VKAWSGQRIRDEKAEVRQLLAAFDAEPDKRLETILTELRKVEDDLSSGGQLRRFVLCMSLLVHQVRFGGLKESQINSAVTTASSILRLNGVANPRSRLTALAAELHIILSQIRYLQGQTWLGAWQRELGERLENKKYSDQGVGIHLFGKAIRYMRLGEARLALATFVEAEKHLKDPQRLLNARIRRIRLLRLRQDYAECLDLIARTEREIPTDGAHAIELSWEKLCVEVQTTANAQPMVLAVSPRGAHRTASYFLEAFLYCQAVAKPPNGKMTAVATAGRAANLHATQEGFFYKAALCLEKSLDREYHYIYRLDELGDVLAQRALLASIDKELLFLLAAARCLIRTRFDEFAELVLTEYVALSRRLTDQKSGDALGIGADLVDDLSPFQAA